MWSGTWDPLAEDKVHQREEPWWEHLPLHWPPNSFLSWLGIIKHFQTSKGGGPVGMPERGSPWKDGRRRGKITRASGFCSENAAGGHRSRRPEGICTQRQPQPRCKQAGLFLVRANLAARRKTSRGANSAIGERQEKLPQDGSHGFITIRIKPLVLDKVKTVGVLGEGKE